MEQFRITEEGYKEYRKRSYKILAPIVIVIVGGIVVLNVVTSKKDDSTATLLVIPVMLVFFGFSIYRSMRKQRQLFMSYSVTIAASEITREQLNTPLLTINFMEIKEIIKTKKGGFMIKGRTNADVIHIPYLIDRAEILEERLKTFGTITVWEKTPWNWKFRGLIVIAGLVAMIATVLVENVVIAGICGVFATSLLIWTFIMVNKSKNVSASVKRKSWTYLLLILFMAYMLYLKLGGTSSGH